MLLDGRAQPTGLKQRGVDATLLLILNAHYDLVNLTLPGHAGDERWRLLIDTNVEGKLAKTEYAKGDVYGVTGRSLLLFQLHGAK
jgi:glycogen operon protein